MDDDDIYADLSIYEPSEGSEYRLTDDSDYERTPARPKKRSRPSASSRAVPERQAVDSTAEIPKCIREKCKFDVDKLPRTSSDPILLLTGEEYRDKCWTCLDKGLPCAILSRGKSCAGCFAKHLSCNANRRVPDFHNTCLRSLYERLQEDHLKTQRAKGVTTWSPVPTHPAKWGVTPPTTSAWRALFSRHGITMPAHFFVRDGVLITTHWHRRPSPDAVRGAGKAVPHRASRRSWASRRTSNTSSTVRSGTSRISERHAHLAGSLRIQLPDLDSALPEEEPQRKRTYKVKASKSVVARSGSASVAPSRRVGIRAARLLRLSQARQLRPLPFLRSRAFRHSTSEPDECRLPPRSRTCNPPEASFSAARVPSDAVPKVECAEEPLVDGQDQSATAADAPDQSTEEPLRGAQYQHDVVASPQAQIFKAPCVHTQRQPAVTPDTSVESPEEPLVDLQRPSALTTTTQVESSEAPPVHDDHQSASETTEPMESPEAPPAHSQRQPMVSASPKCSISLQEDGTVVSWGNFFGVLDPADPASLRRKLARLERQLENLVCPITAYYRLCESSLQNCDPQHRIRGMGLINYQALAESRRRRRRGSLVPARRVRSLQRLRLLTPTLRRRRRR
ncbi:hypothetical protein BCV69DRAFT_62686 [Microstroma glucosiphilum]|uniref:Uncharacterized protein n=1 Tax=Pseudomicrostroma glucosiphilum TaxID=1684307 RepID=A0A316U035_9BASI|nr:hypothetical protein BCV69DRAFT_62686 [Pseudomicrostroma glucosiphilum]PWN18779.1 hypothetical protein BCV69DRAFT_62686 [Pseudomicrostroma glucosiphilum]